MHCFIIFPFFFKYLTNAQYMINSWPVVSNTPWWSPIIPSAYGFNLEGKMLDKIMYLVGNLMCPYNYYNLFFALLIDRYYDGLLLDLRQFILISNRNNKFTNLTANCLTACFKSVLLVFDQYLLICDFLLFNMPSQHERHLAQILVVLLCVFLSA